MTGEKDAALTAYRLDRLEESQASIAESLKALVRLEQHHSDTRAGLERSWRTHDETRRRLEAIDDQIPERLGERLGAIEEAMPNLKLTSGWVVTFTLGGFGLAALLVWNLATADRHHPPITNERRVTVETPDDKTK